MLSTQTKSEELKGSGKRFHVHTQSTASVCAGQITLFSSAVELGALYFRSQDRAGRGDVLVSL